jgi:diketogulonate reductase-like aldo/keto reductase
MLFCSLDSWGRQAEYIRDGLNFETLYNNVTDYLANGKKHSLTFIVTFNALSYTGWLELIHNILKLRKKFNTDRQLIWFDVPQLSSPEWLNPKMLSNMVNVLEHSVRYMKANIETEATRFKGFKDFEISKVQRLIDWIKTKPEFDIIFYDCIHQLPSNRKRNMAFNKLMTTNRHYNTSVFILSQRLNELNPLVRSQADVISYYKPNNM